MSPDLLVRQHADLVYRVALRILRNEADAADAAQEALVKVWRHGAEVPADRLRSWVARVAQNAALDLMRRTNARPRPGMADAVREPTCDADLPDDNAERNDLRRELAAHLGRLDEPYRTIVILRDIEGLAYQEVADALDLPLNTLKVYLHRARKRLRVALQASVPDLVP